MECVFKRQSTTANEKITMEFDAKGIEYLVKNFTDDDIYVALGEENDKAKCLLIPAECSQIVTAYRGAFVGVNDVITIIPESTSKKGVEVQCLKW